MHPVLFEIGPLAVRSYGVFVAAGFFVSFFLLSHEAKREGFFPDKILDLLIFVLIFGVIGARILHVAVNADYYAKNPLEIFFVWHGGLAIYGGVIFGLLAGRVFTLRNKIPFWKAADLFAPYIALGQSIGRIGCFLNGCCYGKITSLPFLGVIFPGENVYRHPTQVYSSLLLLGIFIILKFLRKKPLFEGGVFFVYIMLYSISRLSLDFLRGDNPTYFCNLTVSQIISIALLIPAIFIWRKKT